MPFRRLTDPDKLKALLGAALAIESNLDLDTILNRFVEEAVWLSGARYGALGVLDESKVGLVQFITVGMRSDEIDKIGDLPEGKGVLGLLISEPKPIRLADISAHPASAGFPAGHPQMKSFLGVPIRVRDTAYGNLYLTEKQGGGEFTEEDEDLVIGLATAAGIAIENARLHQRVGELALSDDRERIARDLHDTVIQRLFAIGLSLQSVVRLVGDHEAAQRVQQSIDSLDDTIRQVRTAIFSLEAAPETRKGLRAQILEMTAEAARSLGFDPKVGFSGAIDSQVGDPTSSALLASLREMLANIARHAKASSVHVEVTLEDAEVTVEVVDDGIGVDDAPASRGKGVANMCSRAASLGGNCVLRNAPTGGTAVIWRAPA